MLVVINYFFLTHSQRRIAASGVGVGPTGKKLDTLPINSTPWQQRLTHCVKRATRILHKTNSRWIPQYTLCQTWYYLCN